MASKSNLSKVFENVTKNLSDTIRYNWGIGYMEEQMPEKKKTTMETKQEEISQGKYKRKTKLERLKEAIGEAGSEPESLYKAYKDQYDMMMNAGKVNFAGSKFRLGVKEQKMAGGSSFTNIKEAKASDYRAKHKERMKKFLIERAYTAKA